MSRSEVWALVDTFNGKNEARNRALILVGVNTGFRIKELLSLRRQDVLDEYGNLVESVKVARRYMKGKRSSRVVDLNSGGRRALLALLLALEDQGYILDDDYLFNSQKGGPLSVNGAWRIIVNAKSASGIPPGGVATHSLRKTFADNAYRDLKERAARGIPVDPFRGVSKLLDHMDINSTDKYLSFSKEDVKDTLEAISI